MQSGKSQLTLSPEKHRAISSMTSLERGFDSSEHRLLGDSVTFPELPENHPTATLKNGQKLPLFKLKNGLQLTYGEIVALAADYYGIANDAVSLGKKEIDRAQRFDDAVKQLNEGNPAFIKNIIATDIVGERENIYAGMQRGETETEVLDRIVDNETEVALKNTEAKYLLLALHNMDHFGSNAKKAFITGFKLAMQTAVNASTLADPNEKETQLVYAYFLLAFASHYLSDLFAAGHMRVPRAILEEKLGAEIGSWVTLIQHNWDGDHGLKVKDGLNNSWEATGDGHLFEAEGAAGKERAIKALQVAKDEVYAAYQRGKMPDKISACEVFKYIPQVTDDNKPPMFRLNDDDELECKTNIYDEDCADYIPMTKAKALEIIAKVEWDKLGHGSVAAIQTIKNKVTDFLQRELDPKALKGYQRNNVFDRNRVPSSVTTPAPGKNPEPDDLPEPSSLPCCSII